MKNVLFVLFVVLGVISCEKEVFEDDFKEGSSIQAQFRTDSSELEIELLSVIDYIDSMNILHNGEVYDSLEVGVSAYDLVEYTLVDSTYIYEAFDDIHEMVEEIISEHGLDYLEGWLDENEDEFPTTSKFCFICKTTIYTPPTTLPNGDCFQTEIIQWRFLGIKIHERTGTQVPC